MRPIIAKNADAASMLMTDESPIYPKVGASFAAHGTVNHSASEYARLGGYVHINTAENFYSIVKRGITGVYHSVSEAHLHRYMAEFDFRLRVRESAASVDLNLGHSTTAETLGEIAAMQFLFPMRERLRWFAENEDAPKLVDVAVKYGVPPFIVQRAFSTTPALVPFFGPQRR